jgi:hypothetical protein
MIDSYLNKLTGMKWNSGEEMLGEEENKSLLEFSSIRKQFPAILWGQGKINDNDNFQLRLPFKHGPARLAHQLSTNWPIKSKADF